MVYDTAHQISFTRQYNNTWIIYCTILLAVVISTSLSVVRFGPEMGGDSEVQKVIIDTDPGIDDAVGIMMALGDQFSQLIALTCTRGNTDLPNTAINALKLLLVAKRKEIPVYAGTNYGFLRTPTPQYWFGKDGLGDLKFPNPPSEESIQEEHAGTFLAKTVQKYPGKVTIIAIGPLTNLAVALHLNPNFLVQAKRVIILGGSIKGQGNAAPGVEANFYMDPDAADLVLNRALISGTKLTLLPMDTVLEKDLTLDWRWNVLGEIKNPVVDYLNKLEKKDQAMHPVTKYQLFDPTAVAIGLSSNVIVSSKDYYGFVENTGSKAAGALFIDYINITQTPVNLEVVLDINEEIVKQKMVENLSSFN